MTDGRFISSASRTFVNPQAISPNLMDPERLSAAWSRVQADLLAERVADGHWVGELASSSLSTATAVSALSLVLAERRRTNSAGSLEIASETEISSLVRGGLNWLCEQQNTDGGWGDTDRSYSNISTTMLVRAAFTLNAVPASYGSVLEGADDYIARAGGEQAVKRRYGRDKTFAIPILTNCAIAGTTSWKRVSPLPFELAVLPQRIYHLLQLPVVSYAIPALVAIGQARFHFRKPLNPIMRLIRTMTVEPSLKVLKDMQPASGGFLEAIPLTSFVVMSLAATGRAAHPVTTAGLRFLLKSVRPDGSWPIDTNLATWTTTLAVNGIGAECLEVESRRQLTEWILSCQYRQVHPYTGAAPGGWGWSNLTGAVPDADDTPGALLALAELDTKESDESLRGRIRESARQGIRWLLDLQNRDGGWPTFCKGWGKLPFDRSGTDLTAHVLRALHAWPDCGPTNEIHRATRRGLRFLAKRQENNGCWLPLWFGNQDQAGENNPVYGTSKVLVALSQLGQLQTDTALRARNALLAYQNLDGGWGGGRQDDRQGQGHTVSSIEETALALEALFAWSQAPEVLPVLQNGLQWLVARIESGDYRLASPIGFYFAKLWYHERLYPLVFTAAALRQAVARCDNAPTDNNIQVQAGR